MVSFKDSSEFLIFQAIKAFLFLFPRNICLLAGQAMGLILYYLDSPHRSIALSNLKIAFKNERSTTELRRIARRSFKHFGMVLMDIIKFSFLDEKKKRALIQVEGEEHLDNGLGEKKGALLFTAHFGNWEIGPYFISQKGKLNVIARHLDNKFLEAELHKLRMKQGANVIYKHQATKQILRSLRKKEIVAFLIDQNVQRHQAIFVDFFGKKAATTPGLATFYIKTRAPLIPIFCYPTPASGIKIRIFKPLQISLEGDYKQQRLKITQVCTKIIEDRIRENPDYWLWFHKRWKTRPKDENN